MFLIGEQVQITPRTKEAREFWAFVDGWHGEVRGAMAGGRMVVVCDREDGPKQFYVEPENLTKVWQLPK